MLRTPGPTGFVKHLPSLRGTSYWLGCHPGPTGLDLESDGKSSSSGNPGCGIAADCTGSDSYPLWPPMTFGQDECAGDGVDAGLAFGEFVSNCGYLTRVQFGTYNAGASTQGYLNLLLDMNIDGDWNDSFGECGCLHEWAVKNAPITVPSGCASHDSPPFQIKTWFGAPAWLRITLTDDLVDDDFPWKGSAGLTDDAVHGGETEDYLAAIVAGDPVIPASWGEVKVRYR